VLFRDLKLMASLVPLSIRDASDITFGYRHFWAQNTNLCITLSL
jgi:hypothetical protein